MHSVFISIKLSAGLHAHCERLIDGALIFFSFVCISFKSHTAGLLFFLIPLSQCVIVSAKNLRRLHKKFKYAKVKKQRCKCFLCLLTLRQLSATIKTVHTPIVPFNEANRNIR